jgi:hypothetical protein
MNEDALAQCLAELKKPAVEVHYGNVLSRGKTSKVRSMNAVRKCLSIVTAASGGSSLRWNHYGSEAARL